MTTERAQAFDEWIRGHFRQINTELEELYFARDVRSDVAGVGEPLKQALLAEGTPHIAALLAEGNTDEGYEHGYDLLGNVGFFMAACRRHEIDGSPAYPGKTASALAMQIGAALGVAPRFASAHQETHNLAVAGKYKSFTDLADERLFLEYNTRGVFGFVRAAEALLKCLPLGISHPVTLDLLQVARDALKGIIISNQRLFDELDVDRFFYCVRPYYKPHRVGDKEYRGANAGDFAGINVVDLLLGVCRGDDPYYSQLLVDKFLFMRPEEQLLLRDCMRRPSLLDQFLQALDKPPQGEWFEANVAMFIEVCEAHGQVALQHHEQLVARFIEQPAADETQAQREDLTSSGPPLPVLLASLRKLCDLRAATAREDIPSRHEDLDRLRAACRGNS